MGSPERNASEFIQLVTSPVKFRLFMFAKLPMGLLAGLKVISISEQHASVAIPYKYLNKNPFNSIYFACLSMAAELSTGALCLMHIYKSHPAVSMLVVNMEAEFDKKATGKIIFTCNDGDLIKEAAERTKSTGEGVTILTKSIGVNEHNEQVAKFSFTWSLKSKKAR
jgi:acyl-coenzyme A thioesterase PaaI-like protein